jgi:GT2 family glycosyltransferase
MQVSVITLTYKRLELLKRFLASYENQKDHPFDLKLYIVVNGEDPDTKNYLNHINHDYETICLPQHFHVGEARNLAIKQANGDFICVLDDDIEIPPDYFFKASQLVNDYPQVDVFGGPDATKPNASNFQKVLGEVLKSFLATGPTRRRHTPSKNKYESGNEVKFILCNLWMRTNIFHEDELYFPNNFTRGEENLILAELKRRNKKMIYFSDLEVFHERKTSIRNQFKVTFYSGMFRAIGFFFNIETFKVYFIVPALCLLLFLYVFINSQVWGIYFLVLYISVVIYESIKAVTSAKKYDFFFIALTLFITINLAYALGTLWGLLNVVRYKVFKPGVLRNVR